MLRLECEILNGSLASESELFRLQPEKVLDSPLLSKTLGEMLIRTGRLGEGLRLLSAAVKGLAAQGLQRHMLEALSGLCTVHLRTGNSAEARTILRFLQEQFGRKDVYDIGHVPHALAKGYYLLDAPEDQAVWIQAAFEAYRLEPSFTPYGTLLLDVWTGLATPASLARWETQAAWAQQQILLGKAPPDFAHLIRGMDSYYHARWEEAVAELDQVTDRAVGFFHFRVARVFRFRAACRSASVDEAAVQEDAGELDRMLRMDETDLELRFYAELVKHEWLRSKPDPAAASAARRGASVIYGLTGLPYQGRELAALGGTTAPAAEGKTSGWRIYCFGGLKFVRGGTETDKPAWKRRKTKELFLYLLLQPRYETPRDRAAEILFGEDDYEKAANRLYVAIHELKKMLAVQFGIPDAVSLKEGMVRLQDRMIEYLDIEQYTALARVGEQLWRQDRELSLEMFEKACQMYDELLPETNDLDWLDLYREAFAERQAGMLKRLARHAGAEGRFDQAELYVNEWIRLQPLQEEAHYEMIALLMQSGRKSEASKWYGWWEQTCQRELGSPPMPETKRLLSPGDR